MEFLQSLITSIAAVIGLTLPQTAPAQNFRVVGTEPFWGMQITQPSITFEVLGQARQTFRYVPPIQADGKPPDVVRVYQLGAGNTLIIQRVDRCSDNMSDTIYPYSVVFIRGRQVLSGCADKMR